MKEMNFNFSIRRNQNDKTLGSIKKQKFVKKTIRCSLLTKCLLLQVGQELKLTKNTKI